MSEQPTSKKPLYPFLYANPPKGWTGHIPENWREEIRMANEQRKHEHRWGLSDRARCQECGRDAEDIADELAEQLAASDRQQATLQAALDSSLALQQEDEQTIGEMRALLERTVTIFSVIVDVGIRNANQHLNNIRAFLAAHPAPVGGLENDDDE